VDRLMYSARIYRMELPFTRDQIRQVCMDVVAVNDLKACYLRPLIYRGYENLGVNPFGSPVEVAVAAFPWGKYLGDDALTKGVAVKISSWWRFAPNTLPAIAKASANYMNSQLIKMEALLNGCAEGIALDDRGYVSEGSGENIFTVSNGTVLTPPLSSSILAGITRDSVIQICHELDIVVKERSIQRAALYVADELFFSGTAAEITPIRSVDRITVGAGGRGPITEKIQKAFFEITKGERKAPGDWLTYVNTEKSAQPGSNGSQPATNVSVGNQTAEPVMKFQTAASVTE